MANSNTLPAKLNEKLQSGIVTFSFKKANGEVRYAVGTTCNDLMPADKVASGATDTPTLQKYYDFIKKDWRSVKKDEIIRIATTVIK